MSHSPYPGVLWHSRDKRYRVRVRCGRDRRVDWTHEAFSQDAEIAAKVCDVIARLLKGPNAEFSFDGLPPAEVSESEIIKMLQDRGFLDPDTGALVL